VKQSYNIKEIYKTIQGEGKYAGRMVVILRFANCNLSCPWCDTDYKGGERVSLAKIVGEVLRAYGARPPRESDYRKSRATVIATGGEPLLQLDKELTWELSQAGFNLHVETNGTIDRPMLPIEHLTVSPKPDTHLKITVGDELKLVWPQPGFKYRHLVEFEKLAFGRHSLQPMDDDNLEANIQECLDIIWIRPTWELSLQLHKMVGIK